MPVLFIPSLHRKLASEAKPSDNCLSASLFMWRQFGTGKDAGKAVCIRVFRRKTKNSRLSKNFSFWTVSLILDAMFKIKSLL